VAGAIGWGKKRVWSDLGGGGSVLELIGVVTGGKEWESRVACSSRRGKGGGVKKRDGR